MPFSSRPNEDYPRWATDGAADVVEPNSGRKNIGFEEDDVAAEAEHNWLLNKVHEWTQYFDESRLGWEAFGEGTWKTPGFTYATGASLTQPLGAGVLYIDGTRVEFDAQYLADIGEDTHTFAASSTTTVAVGRLSEAGGTDTRWTLDFRTAGGTPAGFTDVMAVTTDGSGVTGVTSSIEQSRANATEEGAILVAPLRLRGDFLEFRPSTGTDFDIDWMNPGGSQRFNLRYDESVDRLIMRPRAGGFFGAPVWAVDNATARMIIANDGSAVADVNAAYDALAFGSLTDDFGVTFLLDTEFRLVFTHSSGAVNGYIGYTSTDILSLFAGADGLHFGNDELVPDAGSTYLLGTSAATWGEGHIDDIFADSISGQGAFGTLDLGRTDGGNVNIRAAGNDATGGQSSFERWHHGMAAGAYDSDYHCRTTRAFDTNTNGNEDQVVFPASQFSVDAAYMVTYEILGVENADASASYGRVITQIYHYEGAVLASSHNIRDTGVGGGSGDWPGTSSAGITFDGSGNMVVRVTAADTLQRNWIVHARVLRIQHAE